MLELVRKFLQEIKVYDCGMTKMRIGNEGDGGYVVLKELCERAGPLYSCGIGDDVGFELDFVKRFPKTSVFLYDPSISALPKEHPNFTFVREFLRPDVIFGQNLVLKMDIEWDEWATLRLFGSEILCLFEQMVIEFHVVHIDELVDPVPFFQRGSWGGSSYFLRFYRSVIDKLNERLFGEYRDVLKMLNEFFYIYHIHANNSLLKVRVGGDVFPPLLELSFVRKDLVSSANAYKGSFPVVGLDFPNKTDRADIKDYYPLVA